MLIRVLLLVISKGATQLDVVEFMAGTAKLSAGFMRYGYNVFPYELGRDSVLCLDSENTTVCVCVMEFGKDLVRVRLNQFVRIGLIAKSQMWPCFVDFFQRIVWD